MHKSSRERGDRVVGHCIDGGWWLSSRGGWLTQDPTSYAAEGIYHPVSNIQHLEGSCSLDLERLELSKTCSL